MSDAITGAELAKQVEVYSNAIVAFAVLQSLAYSYYFGTNPLFNCLVKTAQHLAAGLTVMFVLGTTLLAVAIHFLGRTAAEVAGQFKPQIRRIYQGKMIAVLLFNSLSTSLTIGYGLFDYPSKYECSKTKVAGDSPMSSSRIALTTSRLTLANEEGGCNAARGINAIDADSAPTSAEFFECNKAAERV